MIRLDDRMDPLASLNLTSKSRSGEAALDRNDTQLVSIPENSDPFYTVSNSYPLSPSSETTSPLLSLENIFITHHKTLSSKRRKCSVEPPANQNMSDLAEQIIPKSTKCTKEQKLKKDIRALWERRFTPARVANKLYIPGVLYATRARFVRNEADYWIVSQDVDKKGGKAYSHDPLADYHPHGIAQLSVYLRRGISSNPMFNNTPKPELATKNRPLGVEAAQKWIKQPTEPSLKAQAVNEDNRPITTNQHKEDAPKIDRKRRGVAKNARKFLMSQGKTVQTFERRKTRPDDSMYESIDPIILNKTKLSKAFCDG